MTSPISTQELNMHTSCECAIQSLIRLELEIYYAVKDRDLVKLERMMNSGLDANHMFSEAVPGDAQNGTILELAVQENFLVAVRQILFHRPEEIRETTVQASFTYAMKNNMLDIIRLILKAVAEDQVPMELASAFRHAMYKSQYDLVAKIIEKTKFNVNLEATWGLDKPLHIVVHHNQADLVEKLLKHNAVIDAEDRKGVTPLIVACYLSTTKCVDMLLRHGADPSHKACRDLYNHHSPLYAVFRFSNCANTAHHIISLLIMGGLNLKSELWLMSQNSQDNIHEQTLKRLKELASKPQPLKGQCFVLIRRNLLHHTGGASILSHINSLPIAPGLKKYLQMQDVNL